MGSAMCRSPLQVVCICAICLTVAGCITGAQKESTRIQRAPAEPTTLGLDCVQRVAENPEYEGIKAKLYFGADNQPPLEMLADKSHPSKEHIKLLYEIRDNVQRCRKILLEGPAKTHPVILSALVNAFTESDKLWAEAAGGKLAWGTFNQRAAGPTVRGRRRDLSQRERPRLRQARSTASSCHSSGIPLRLCRPLSSKLRKFASVPGTKRPQPGAQSPAELGVAARPRNGRRG